MPTYPRLRSCSRFRLPVWLFQIGLGFWLDLHAAVIPGELIVRIELKTTGQGTYSVSSDGATAHQEENIVVNMTGEAHYALEDVGGDLLSGDLLRFTSTESVSGTGISTARDASGFTDSATWSYVNHPDFGKTDPGFSGSLSLASDPTFNSCQASPLFPAVEWRITPDVSSPWKIALDRASEALQNLGDIDFTPALPVTRVSWKSTKSKSATASLSFPGGTSSGNATCTVTMELKLTPVPDWEAVFVLDPRAVPSYQDWLPIGGTNEINPGNFLGVGVKVRAADGSARVPPSAKFTFNLRDVSREPGISMNFPQRSEPANRSGGTFPYDLRLRSAADLDVEADGQQAVTRDFTEGSGVAVECFDYGAFGKLEITVRTEDGATFKAHLEGDPSQTWLTIPMDNNGNEVADYWEKTRGVFSRNLPANWDGNIDPKYQDQAVEGDGISLYEKYRGFHVLRRSIKTVHERLDPRAKYVFIHNPDRLLSEVFNSTDGFPVSYMVDSLCRVLYIGTSGWTGPGAFADAKRIVNFNCSTDKHVVDQHALYVTLNPSRSPFSPEEWLKVLARRGLAGDPTVKLTTLATAYPDTSGPAAFRFNWRPARCYQIEVYANTMDYYQRLSVGWHSRTLSAGLNAAQKEALVDNYISSHWDDYRHKYTLLLSATLSHEMGHATGILHHDPETSDFNNPALSNCTMRYYNPREFPSDLNDRFELKARGQQPGSFCRTDFNCWGQLQVSDNPNASHGLSGRAAAIVRQALAGDSAGTPSSPDDSAPTLLPETFDDELRPLELSAELVWPVLVAGDPLRLWVRLHGATGATPSNWTDGVHIELAKVEADGKRKTVLGPVDWAGKLQPAGFDTSILAVTNVTLIREWLAPAAAAQLTAGKYVLELSWDGKLFAPDSVLPAGGILTLAAMEFEVQAPATDAQLALHHRHLAWAAWVAGDDAGVMEHAREAARLDDGATDSLSMAIRFISASSALRQGDAMGAARIMGDLGNRFRDGSDHLGEMAATRFEVLAPRVRVVEAPAANQVLRLEIAGLTGSTYVLQRSSDLKAWTSISTHTLPGYTAVVEDSGAGSGAARFYRVLWER